MSINTGNNVESTYAREKRVMATVYDFETELREHGEKVDEPNDMFTSSKEKIFVHADEVVDIVELDTDKFEGQLRYAGDTVIAMDAERNLGDGIYERATVERLGKDEGHRYTLEKWEEKDSKEIKVLDDTQIETDVEREFYG
jgi:hypothetical protein